MIIKGSSRAAPKQLAVHLQRVDTNEIVRVLELDYATADLHEAFRDWQTLSEATKGSKGLYHANIDPDARYTMTPEQWRQAADVLEKELGFEGQPRAVVMHEKNGRQHIHVVWARTDVETMTLRPDSQNYKAHERASQKLELEFGHEPVPGKHAKRDREKQPEIPKAEINHAEWQQAKRTGISPKERKEQVTALFRASDSGQAFKAALEEAGYILAKGDRRDFVIVDEHGEIHSLARQVNGIKAKDLREFMGGIADIPTASEAKEAQRTPREALKPPALPRYPKNRQNPRLPRASPKLTVLSRPSPPVRRSRTKSCSTGTSARQAIWPRCWIGNLTENCQISRQYRKPSASNSRARTA